MATYKLKLGVKEFKVPGTRYTISSKFIEMNPDTIAELHDKFQMVQRRVDKDNGPRPRGGNKPQVEVKEVEVPEVEDTVETPEPAPVSEPKPKAKSKSRSNRKKK